MFRWKAAVAALSLALIVTVWMLAQQQRASAAVKTPVLTALDYAEIGQLVNRYGQAIDTCSNNGYDYADLYTVDGVFIDKITPNGFAKGGRECSPRAASNSRKWWAADRSAASAPPKGPPRLLVTDRSPGMVGATSW